MDFCLSTNTLLSWGSICEQHPAVPWAFSAPQAFLLGVEEGNKDLSSGKQMAANVSVSLCAPAAVLQECSKTRKSLADVLFYCHAFAHELNLGSDIPPRWTLGTKPLFYLHPEEFCHYSRGIGLGPLWLSSAYIIVLVLAGMELISLIAAWCNALVCDQSSVGNSLMF